MSIFVTKTGLKLTSYILIAMYLLFDIGGTHMRLATNNDNVIENIEVYPTPIEFKDALEIIKDYASKFGNNIEGISGGIAGPFDKARSFLMNAPNLKNWINIPIKEMLREITRNVKLENDAAIAGLGESVYGIGKNHNIIAYLTIGTGVGGVRIINKRIDVNNYGFEPGHQIIGLEKNTPVYLEDIISGGSIYKKYNKQASEINDDAFWDNVIKTIAAALNNVTVMWTPDIIILGGGLVVNDIVDLTKLREYFKDSVRIYKELPNIVKAELKDNAGLYGALVNITMSDTM